MDAGWSKRVLIIGAIGVALIAARTAYILHERSKPFDLPLQRPKSVTLTDDDYVRPSQIVPYDLKSAQKELVGKMVWVRNGNSVGYYDYREASRSVDFGNKAGLLSPLEKLQIKDVILARPPVSLPPGQVVVVRHQIMAVFRETVNPGIYAVSIGNVVGDDFTFTVNDLFFYEDPHELYKHWPPNVWASIDAHRVEKGMNELQVSFALGAMVAAGPGEYGNRTAQYHSGWGLVTVSFEKNRVTEITPPQH